MRFGTFSPEPHIMVIEMRKGIWFIVILCVISGMLLYNGIIDKEYTVCFDNYVEYLSEKSPEKIKSSFDTAISSMPTCVLYAVKDRGFRIKIVDDISNYVNNISKDTVGLYVDADNCIYLKYKALLSDTNVLQHEMGHYIYFRLHLEDNENLSESYMSEWDDFIDLYRDYGAKNEVEYFAEYFAIYCNGEIDEGLKFKTPKTYYYMSNLYFYLEKADLIIDLF